MNATLGDIIQIMETIAPAYLAESWDNAGLQVGEKSWPVKKIWIALDPTPEVVSAACSNKVNLLITHHPLIFSPLKTIDFSTPIGSIIQMASKHNVAIFSAHTNLDNTHNGINDILAKKIGLENVNVLKQSNTDEIYKLVVFVPKSCKEKILDTLIEINAGETNHHTQCSAIYNEQETLKESNDTKPLEDKPGEIKKSEIIKIETTIHKKNLSQMVDHIRTLHPHEIMNYDIYPLLVKDTANGAGRIGDLIKRIRLSSFADRICKQFGIPSIKVAGNPDLLIDRVAVCSGSGASMINEFISSGAQVFVSGDLRYHEARLVEQAGLAVVDIGHFVSEFIVVDELEKRLREILYDKKIDASVESCSIERDPFWSPTNR